MSEEQRSKRQGRSPESQKQPPIVNGPSTIMEPESFSKWMTFAVSPEFLTKERVSLLKEMSEDLARDPALLRFVERMLSDYRDRIYEVSPNNAELREKGAFTWVGEQDQAVALVPPAAAAAALAPPAAALAAAHAPGE